MAGPWYVDPDDGLTTNNGLSAETPWKLIPGQSGASGQTGYGVVAGDVVNVKNGSVTALQIVPPANNITYRGYGLADNVLVLTLPVRNNPASTRLARITRATGLHEGMWSIEGCASSSCIDTSVRSGVVFEDVRIVGNSNQTSRVVALAASSQNSTGCVLRRFAIYDAPKAAISAYCVGITLEQGLIYYPAEDGILIGAATANSSRAGGSDVLRQLMIVEPGWNSAVGDAVQTIPNSGSYLSALLLSDIYVRKANATKQAMLLSDATGGFTLERFHFSSTDSGHCQIGIETLKGALTVRDGYVKEGGADNALVRFVTSSGTAAATGSLLRIKNVIHDAETSAGFFTAASLSLAGSADGAIEIENCTSMAANDQGLSYSGAVSFAPGALLTWGVNATASVKNCNLSTPGGYAVRLPSGVANDADWSVSGNCVRGGSFSIGASDYASVAVFEAAHSAATLNTEEDPMVTDQGAPLPGSPLLTQGADLGYRRDIRGFQSRRHIGAYGAAQLRAD